MYKYLSIILGVGLLVLGGVALYQKHVADKAQRELNNQIAELQGTIKEKDGLYSQQAVVLQDAQDQLLSVLENKKAVEELLKARGEEVYALNQLVLQWKSKYFEIKDATGTVVGEDGTTVVEISADCQACVRDLRFRVDFDQTQDYMKVTGHTLTNPAYAELKLEWTRDLKINIIIAKDDDDKLRAYMDTNNSDIVPSKLSFVVDESVFDLRWYQKLYVGGSVNVGQGLLTNLGVGYEILDGLSVGPSMSLFYDGERLRKMYGASTQWYPLR